MLFIPNIYINNQIWIIFIMTKLIAKIIAISYEELRSLDKYHLDLKELTARKEGPNRFIVTGILSDEQIHQVRSAGLTVEILSDLSQISKDRINEVSKSNRFMTAKKASELQASAETGGYMNADEVDSAMLNLEEAHPDFISIINLPNRTIEGRLSRAIHIHAGKSNSNSVNSDTQTGVLITGGICMQENGVDQIFV
jgi:carboxypeptidase T